MSGAIREARIKALQRMRAQVREVEYAFHIVNHRDNANGTRSYRVRYDGYRKNEDQWLPSRQVDPTLAADYFQRRGE